MYRRVQRATVTWPITVQSRVQQSRGLSQYRAGCNSLRKSWQVPDDYPLSPRHTHMHVFSPRNGWHDCLTDFFCLNETDRIFCLLFVCTFVLFPFWLCSLCYYFPSSCWVSLSIIKRFSYNHYHHHHQSNKIKLLHNYHNHNNNVTCFSD
jgi:hypothetical protein